MEIYKKKKAQERILLSSNNKILAIIYKGLATNRNIRDIHRDIRKIMKKLPIQDHKIYKYALKVAKKGKIEVERQVNGAILLLGAVSDSKKNQLYKEYSFKFLDSTSQTREKTIYQDFKKLAYDRLQKTEADDKEQVIKEVLKSDKIYFLCSEHEDCAKDHKHAQGQLYYNREFRKILPKSMWKDVEDYNNKHHLLSVQKIMGRPTWLVTRPNCRHYFKRLSVDEVLGGATIQTLLQTYDMHKQIGVRTNIQSIYHSTKKEWYTQENILSMIKKYEERLRYHEALYSASKNVEIERAIDKDKELLAKWKTFYRNGDKVIKVK